MQLIGPPIGPPKTVHNLLQDGLTLDPDKIALQSLVQQLNYRDLERAVNRLAGNLLDLGLSPGDRVASLLPNRIALLIFYLACLRIGLVAVPLNYRYLAGHIDHALEVSGAILLVAHGERADDLASCRHTNRLKLGIRWFEHSPTPGAERLEPLIDNIGSDQALPVPRASDPCCIFFTSGSTGQPKGVTHTHASFGAMLTSVVQALEFTPDDVVLPGSSISHLGGYLFSLTALSIGAKAAVARSLASVDMIPLLRQTKPSVLCMLPTALLQLLHQDGLKREDFAALRLCRGGADKVPAELEREFIAITGFPIDEGYGMTEIGSATVHPPSGEIRVGSIGRALPGFKLSIRDEDGRELGPGEEGLLWMQSPTMTSGYWNRPDATAELIQGGWLNSGDLVTADNDGYLWFRGRKKQIIVHDGSNICPQEVEEALLEHPAVENAGAIGVHNTLHGENVWAYVTLNNKTSAPDEAELILLARKLIGYKAPEHVFFIEEMPLNPTGKVDRVTLKQWALDRHEPHPS
ncbi:MAG: class I adenylate-forming enzyme family protein [Pseudomonadota bacterium]